MAAVKLEQYLASILSSNAADTNELQLQPGNHAFNLLRIYLENHNTGLHRYQTAKAELLYAAQGTTKVNINGQKVVLKAGNMVLVPDQCNYELFAQGKNDLLVKLEFHAKLDQQFLLGDMNELTADEQQALSQVMSLIKTKHVLLLKCTQMSKTAQLLNKIIDEYLKQNLFTSSIISAELHLLFAAAIRNHSLLAASAGDREFAPTTLEQYIEDNFTNITLDKAAKHFGFNPNYFSSLVKQKTGKSFVEHVDERRMEEARRLLARPDISVKEIISRVGYSGKSFFYKKFNEYYHETPVQMRVELFRQANINLK